MASIGFLISGALIIVVIFCSVVYLKNQLIKNERDMIKQLKICNELKERLDYINNEIAKEHKADNKFMDLNSAMQQYFLVTGRQLQPLPPEPILSDFFTLKTTTIEN